jgi:ABC-2 type transport system ATP-binding protein
VYVILLKGIANFTILLLERGNLFVGKNEDALELENISKVIGNKVIVKNISLTAHHGEVFGLLGPNGAGKTTIMRMVAGLIKPTRGNVYIEGINVESDFEKAVLHLGTIIENPQFYNHLSGYLNLKIVANMFPDVKNDRIKEVAKIVGLSGRLGEKVKNYSLGMRQRLGIAAALINSPGLLVLDEPTNGLDPSGIREMRDKLRGLAHNEGVCVVISSHLLSEMELICDRFAIINKGIHIETKEIGESTNNNILDVNFELLDAINQEELNKVLSQIGVEPNIISERIFSISNDREMVSKVIAEMVKAKMNIVSVIPNKTSLEEYFIERTGVSTK